MSALPFALNSMMSKILFGATGVLMSFFGVGPERDTNLHRLVQTIELGKSSARGVCTGVDRFQLNSVQLTLQAEKRTEPGPSKNRQILQQWSGDYPVVALNRLPKGQRNAAVGYIGDPNGFRSVWQAFMPGTIAPNVDFSTDLIVFARNVRFYNHTSIASVKDDDGVLEVIAMETMSSLPIGDKVSFAMAVVGREGATSLKTANKILRIPAGKRE